jgi:hypothetical protein
MKAETFEDILILSVEEMLPQPIENIESIEPSEDFGNIFIRFNNGDAYYITINKFDKDDYDDYLEELEIM